MPNKISDLKFNVLSCFPLFRTEKYFYLRSRGANGTDQGRFFSSEVEQRFQRVSK